MSRALDVRTSKGYRIRVFPASIGYLWRLGIYGHGHGLDCWWIAGGWRLTRNGALEAARARIRQYEADDEAARETPAFRRWNES